MNATCGNLGDGKPCEFLLEFVQTGWSCANGFTRLSEDACAPVLALLDARREVAMVRSEVSEAREWLALEKGAHEMTTGEAIRWHRAAVRMAYRWANGSEGRNAADLISWALGDEEVL